VSEADAPALIDASCLVRYLTGDPPEMADRAAEFIDGDRPLIVSELALAETAWVLESFYELPREAVVDALMALVRRSNVSLLNLSKPLALEALLMCRPSRRISFVDALLWGQARESGVACLCTFDQRFPSEGLELLGRDEPEDELPVAATGEDRPGGGDMPSSA
jgi:predicted nucleic acid-binding protein